MAVTHQGNGLHGPGQSKRISGVYRGIIQIPLAYKNLTQMKFDDRPLIGPVLFGDSLVQ